MPVSETELEWRARSTIRVEEAAPILGISRSSAYSAAHAGDLPVIRIGRRYLVPTVALRRMLGELPATEIAA